MSTVLIIVIAVVVIVALLAGAVMLSLRRNRLLAIAAGLDEATPANP